MVSGGNPVSDFPVRQRLYLRGLPVDGVSLSAWGKPRQLKRSTRSTAWCEQDIIYSVMVGYYRPIIWLRANRPLKKTHNRHAYIRPNFSLIFFSFFFSCMMRILAIIRLNEYVACLSRKRLHNQLNCSNFYFNST
jgi:hypothetical protein